VSASHLDVVATPLPGAYVLEPRQFADARGLFVKTLHLPSLERAGLDFVLREEFYSVSGRDVLRGMHFQVPPHDHAKIVHCLVGAVLDVIVDLRRESPTFGRHHALQLDETDRRSLLVPSGLAHGFLALADRNVVVYKTSCEHVPAAEGGILWNSFGFDWPVQDPVLSDRDRAHPRLADFASPF